ncbi:MAG: phosphoribosylamine--glycine ligase [Planctomycetes bacterium]|nr:phosphoribosylamine--glycine ligase [Planctomycetota bacterium]
MRVLVIGGGGREHALVWKLRQSEEAPEILCAPGNAGIALEARCVPIAAEDVAGLVRLARDERVDLVVVGPEAPLAAGLVDALEAEGVRAFGPRKQAAEIEASKAWCHEFLERHGVPAAGYRVFRERAACLRHIEEAGAPVVVKASGLAAGKGAIVCASLDDARRALDAMFVERAFGDAGDTVVVEEYLEGEEASCLAITDGETFLSLVPSQDHKAVYDGDKGPNTGGMGAYAPAPIVTEEIAERVEREILRPTIEGLAREGRRYVGVLYAGLMITDAGPRVIEFNCRFGDPETQVVLPLLEADLLDLLDAAAAGCLAGKRAPACDGAAVTVVLASGGYPGAYRRGLPIEGLDDVSPNVMVFHAGTALRDGRVVTAGGRVLDVTTADVSLRAAIDRAYAAIEGIRFEGMYCRRDIGHRALARLRA